MYDLIIIGSGPAGLSAAVYGKRAGLNLLIIEEKPMSGGQILNTYEVDNYLGLPGISGFDMGMTFRHHAEKLGAEFLEATRRLQMRLCGQPGTGDPYGDLCHRCGTCQIRSTRRGRIERHGGILLCYL